MREERAKLMSASVVKPSSMVVLTKRQPVVYLVCVDNLLIRSQHAWASVRSCVPCTPLLYSFAPPAHLPVPRTALTWCGAAVSPPAGAARLGALCSTFTPCARAKYGTGATHTSLGSVRRSSAIRRALLTLHTVGRTEFRARAT